MTDRQMTQYAPWPDELIIAVAELRYIDGWKFRIYDEPRDFADPEQSIPIAGGLTFEILVPCHDSYHPERYRPVRHLHPVPAATFNRQSWERWLFDRLMDTIRHEAAEWFRFETGPFHRDTCPAVTVSAPCSCGAAPADVRRPFAPTHGPGDDPYVLHEYATEEQRRTSFRGELNPEAPA